MKLIISFIFYKKDNPELLKYCVYCRKYKSIDDFDDNTRCCNTCRKSRNDIEIAKINKIVASYFNLSLEKMLSKDRHRDLVIGRQISMYFSKKFTKLSDKMIGYNVGGFDRNTVKHAVKTVNNDSKRKSYKRDLIKLEKLILKSS